MVISSKKTKIISTRPKKIDPTNQVLFSEENDENKEESEAMHVSINQIKPVSPLTYSVARYYYLEFNLVLVMSFIPIIIGLYDSVSFFSLFIACTNNQTFRTLMKVANL